MNDPYAHLVPEVTYMVTITPNTPLSTMEESRAA
jgi:hypothetical protein